MKAVSPLLLGVCTPCGQPIYRHRLPNGRQITCAALRLLDEQFQALPSSAQQPQRALHTTARIIQFSEKAQ